jgi:hypothetical protein
MKRIALLSMAVFISICATQAFANPLKLCSDDGKECCIVFDDGSVKCYTLAT